MVAKLLDEVLLSLSQAGASMRCQDLTQQLEFLGFIVRNGKRGGHKVFVHNGIAGFLSGAFNCDHGKNPEIKRPYINNVIKILRKHEPELREYLEKHSHV